MKKTLAIIFAFCIISCVPLLVTSSNQLTADIVQYKIVVDGVDKTFSDPIVSINDRTYLPLREMAETLGMKIDWNADEETIVISSKDTEHTATETTDGSDFVPFIGEDNDKNKKFGYRDGIGKIVIEPQFDEASDFKEGFAVVAVDGQYGYINVKGKIVIPCMYWQALPFSDGIALVELSIFDQELSQFFGEFCYIDKTGKVLFDGKQFGDANSFSEGYAVIATKGAGNPIYAETNRYSYINTKGERATNQEYRSCGNFKDGHANVSLPDGTAGVIDTNFNFTPNP